MNKGYTLPPKSSIKSFTLIELIVVIIIVGILVAVGLTQYSLIVEKSRLAEAKVRLSAMSKLAYEYYLNNGTFVGITNADLGVDDTCVSTDYYRYGIPAGTIFSSQFALRVNRCTAGGGGKPPPGPAYYVQWTFYSSRILEQCYANASEGWVIYPGWGGCCR